MLAPAWARYITDYGRQGMPSDTVGCTKALLLDFLAVGIFASSQPWAAEAGRLFSTLGSAPHSRTFAGPRLSAPHAAYLNAMLAHSADLDDSHLSGVVHPGAAIMAAALAVGEWMHAPGADVLRACVPAYEIVIRLGKRIQPQHMWQGFHGTATCGVFGATAAAGRLLGLSAEETRNALGLAASSASGLAQFLRFGTSVKRFQVGKSAHDGIMAALLARAGFDAPGEAIDGPGGFVDAYAVDAPPSDGLEDLGRSASLFDVMLKRHPVAAHLHGVVDAALRVGLRLSSRLEGIQRVTVTIEETITRSNAFPAPMDLQGARMSLPFCVACALWAPRWGTGQDGLLTLDDLQRALAEPHVRALAHRVECVPWPDIGPAEVGRSMRARVAVAIGDELFEEEAAPAWGWRDGAMWPEAEAKFRRLTLGGIPERVQHRVVEAVSSLETMADVQMLMKILVG